MRTDQLKTLSGSAVQYEASNNSRIPVSKYEGKIVEITKKFEFEAGHYVPGHEGRCKYVHGHSYKLYVTLSGPISENGVVVDFSTLNSIVVPLINERDHGFMNDIYEFPTAEVMAAHLMDSIESALETFGNVHCEEVKLYETEKCCATVRRKRCDCDG